MSNFAGFGYFQTFISLGVKQGLWKLPKFDINDFKLLIHCYILIPKKCPRKTPLKTQCGGTYYANHIIIAPKILYLPTALWGVNVTLSWKLCTFMLPLSERERCSKSSKHLQLAENDKNIFFQSQSLQNLLRRFWVSYPTTIQPPPN